MRIDPSQLRRFSDELQLKLYLARMDARDYWHAVRPRIAEQLHDRWSHLREEVFEELDPERPR